MAVSTHPSTGERRRKEGRRALDGVPSPHPLGRALPAQFQPALTPPERLLLKSLVAGRSIEEAAREAGVPPSTGRERLRGAMAKLGAETLATAAERLGPDDFVQRLCEALDDILAPIWVTIDNLDAYVDAHLAPDDFVDLLAAWTGAERHLEGISARRRSLVVEAVTISRWRGTARALQRLLELFTGAEVEIDDTGGSAWIRDGSEDTGRLFDDAAPCVRIRVKEATPGDDARFKRALTALVAAAMPAHVPAAIEVVAE
jgi:phage tail-like protein